MKNELVIVLDFGGQYNQLVARRVRECNVYCEIYSYKTDIEKIKAMNPKGIILTGGPNSCYLPDSPTYSDELFKLGIPVLGLCYGAQLMMHVLGGKVEKADVREYGKTEVLIDKVSSKVFADVGLAARYARTFLKVRASHVNAYCYITIQIILNNDECGVTEEACLSAGRIYNQVAEIERGFGTYQRS